MLETGVPNLDTILGGGVPDGDVLLVVGPAGSGKTTLTLQTAFHTAAGGRNALFASTLSESPNRLLKHTRGFSFYDETLLDRDLFLLSIYPLIRQGLDDVAAALTRAVKEHEARLLVLDGLMTLRELHGEAPELSTFLYDQSATLAALDCTMMVTSTAARSSIRNGLSEFTMADGLVELGTNDVGTRTVRTIRVSKMRGLDPLPGTHALKISADGAAVFPRIEALYTPGEAKIAKERLALGLPELNAMLDGGLPAGSSTVIAGALGTGKTLTCLQFIMDGVEEGQKGMIAGFRETPRQLMDKARNFGMDLESAVDEGSVFIFHRPAVDMILDEISFDIFAKVRRFEPERVAVDSVVELEYAIQDDQRRRGYVTALTEILRAEGATAVFTVETAQIVGPELDFSRTVMAVLAENLIMYRNVEFRGELVGVVSILKMRDSAYDSSIRQYEISESGITVIPREEMAEGVLAAISRLPGEVRTRRSRREDRSI